MAKLVLVAIGERRKKVSFTGSSLEELNEAIENKFADCIPNCCRNSHLQIFDEDFKEYVDLTDVSEVKGMSRLRVVLQEDGVEEQAKESPVMVPYCTDSLGEDEAEASGDANQEGAGGFALKTNIWPAQTNVLYVKFLNSKILKEENWKCGRAVLSIETILAWAAAWNTKKCPKIPIFENTDRADSADIRVKFEGGECWSVVGSQAMTVQDKKPTMILSLKGLDQKMQKFLVMHEFGHALGLFHEHQRSDFWKVANSLLDVKKMKNDPRMKKMNFDRDILEKQPQNAMVMTPEYDPDSIMHYWFDVDWLKNMKYKNLEKVEADGSLSEDQKSVLRGIHKRHLSYADSPSQKDLDFLQEIYGSLGSASGQPPPPPVAPSYGRKDQPTKPKVTPEATVAQLNQQCSNDALLDLSAKIADYNGFKFRLGLSDAEINAIDLTISDIPGRCYAALKKWRSKGMFDSTATYGRLVEIARILDDGEAFQSIQRACIEHTSR